MMNFYVIEICNPPNKSSAYDFEASSLENAMLYVAEKSFSESWLWIYSENHQRLAYRFSGRAWRITRPDAEEET